ncbi:MAG TPA: glycosyltransferase family 9 protein [Salinisphaeraceae bacterium]|nr:glycosyltransferase family 9 protein [Salinisphaeraceae bacterium]
MATPPQSLCLLRLSAIGDCANVVPIVHTLQAHWPQTRLAWVINRVEAALVGDLPGVDFYVMDKRAGRAGLKALRRQLRGARFDVLLHMHASWRANRVSRLIRAPRRLGFDALRTRDGQCWFVNERIQPAAGRHVVDGFFAFLEQLGLRERVYDWHVPIGAADRAHAEQLLGADAAPILFISPCSSHARLAWAPERYAAVAEHARQAHGMRPVLVGGPSAVERRMAANINAALPGPALDLVGQTSLKQLLALFERGRILLGPDSGPGHMANAVGLDVIGLHAATDSRRSGSYLNRALSVDYFDQAARRYRNATADTLPWGTRIENIEGIMQLIPVAAVTARLDQVLAGNGMGAGAEATGS